MIINLIEDAWIPVISKDGAQRLIRPDQIAEPDIVFPDWPRPDLNIACLELLIGLIYLAAPVEEAEDWLDVKADPSRLREKLAPLSAAFNLGGDGPRFMQDIEHFETANTKSNLAPPDMLFIDSAGGQTAKNNADLMVQRGRYPLLDPAMAAMALYTLQSQAPAGGAGNRTSMRGGGPLITLVQPKEEGLWPLIWANVPLGTPQGTAALPWMRRTITSDQGKTVDEPEDANLAEAFFGMPRRLRLIFEEGQVSGVMQKPYGTNYSGWRHPLSPYYRLKAGSEWLPQHPKAGSFGYRNWLGINAATRDENRRQAAALPAYHDRVESSEGATVIVAGWSMDNMKPRDFILSHAPLISDINTSEKVQGMVAGAEIVAAALRNALKAAVSQGTALDSLREEFFLNTQGHFEKFLGHEKPTEQWLQIISSNALSIFDKIALPGISDRRTIDVKKILDQRKYLVALLTGRSKAGQLLYSELQLTPPVKEVA